MMNSNPYVTYMDTYISMVVTVTLSLITLYLAGIEIWLLSTESTDALMCAIEKNPDLCHVPVHLTHFPVALVWATIGILLGTVAVAMNERINAWEYHPQYPEP